MASSFLSRPGQPASPLIALAKYFREARQRDGIVSLPANTSQAIQQYRPSQAFFKADEVEVTVDAIDVGNSNLCNRLDRIGVAVFCSILTYSEPCRAQQRGLCLLAESLHGTQSDTPQVRTDKRITKVQVGTAAISSLIKGFIVTGAPEQTRRWMGVLALEMLRECPENTKKLQDDSDHRWKHLSEVIKRERCQVLKLLARSIIRQMLFHGVSPESFWSPEDDPDMHARFPKSQYHDTQWITSFEGFVNDLESPNVLDQESSVTFAHAALVAGQRYDLHNESAILVTISTDINIIIPASPNESAKFIDIPLGSVLEASLDTRKISFQSQTNTYVLVIHLVETMAATFYVNSVGYTEGPVMLAFRTENAAIGIRDAIIPGNNHRRVRVNQSEPIDVSQRMYDDELGDLKNQDGTMSAVEDLEIMDSRVSALATQSQTVRHMHLKASEDDESSSRRLTDLQQESVAVPTTRRLEQKAKACVSMAMSGIAVHATDVMDVNASGNLEVHDTAFEDSRPSLGRWQNGCKEIDEAPEFQYAGNQNLPLKGQASVAPEASGTNSILADASANHSNVHASSRVLMPQQGQIVQTQDSGGDYVGRNNISAIQAASHNKMAGRTQDDNGMVEGGAPLTAEKDFHASSQTAPEEGERKTGAQNSSAVVSSKPGSKAIKNTYGTRGNAISKGKEKAKIRSLTDHDDDYELSISPEQSSTQEELPKPPIKKLTAKPKPNSSMQQSQTQTGPSSKATSNKLLKRKFKTGFDPKSSKAVKSASATFLQSQGKPVSNATTNEDMMWDEGVMLEEEDAGILSSRSAKIKKAKPKPIKPSDVSNAKQTKKAHTQAATKKGADAKPAPVSLTQPRSRRAAALIANKKIQGLDESDDIMSEEMRSKQPQQEKMAGGEAQQIVPSSGAPQQTSVQTIDRNDVRQAKPTIEETQAEENEATSSPEKVDLIDSAKSAGPIHSPDVQIPSTAAPAGDSPFLQNTKDGEDDVLQVNDSNPPISDTAHGLEQTHETSQHFARNKVPKDLAQGYADQSDQAVQVSTHSRQTLGELDNLTGFRPTKDVVPGRNNHLQQEHSTAKENAVRPKEARNELLPDRDEACQLQKGSKTDRVKAEKRSASPLQRGREKRRKASTEPRDPFAAKLNNAIPSEEKAYDRLNGSNDSRRAQKTLPKHVEESSKPRDRIKFDNERLPKAVSKTDPDAVDFSRGTKRKADIKRAPAPKKAKIVTQDDQETSLPQKDATTGVNAKTPLASKDRKSAFISFDASGPLNQGRTSVKKAQSRAVASTLPVEASRDQHSSKKRNANMMTNSMEAQNSKPLKRQKGSVMSKAATRKEYPVLLEERSGSKTQEMPPRPSSQSTRVNARGSPMPFVHPLNHYQASEHVDPKDEDVRQVFVAAQVEEADGDHMMQHDLEQPNLDLPSAHDTSMPHGIEVKFGHLSSNSKQQPSSPHAPSALSTLTPHHVYYDGQIVNAETSEEIVPSIQQDPFTGRRQHQTSSFMSLLRKSNDMNARLPDQEIKRGTSVQTRNSKLLDMWDDPDKTLVDTEEVDKNQDHTKIPNTSSISNSSPHTVFFDEDLNTEEVSDDEDDDELTIQWRAALKSHQENILSSLEDISHGFLRHLIKKEEIFADMVDDYRNGGEILLTRFANEYNGTLRAYGASTNELKKTMASLFEKTLADVEKSSKQALQRRVKDIECKWSKDQQALIARGDAALATFG